MGRKGHAKVKKLAAPKGKRGRPSVYTPAQKRVLERMLAQTLSEIFRGMVKSLKGPS